MLIVSSKPNIIDYLKTFLNEINKMTLRTYLALNQDSLIQLDP